MFVMIGLLITAVVAPVTLFMVKMNARIKMDVLAAREERETVLKKVERVDSKLEEFDKKADLLHDETIKFQSLVLSSDVFDGAKLKAMAAKRSSGFGELDP